MQVHLSRALHIDVLALVKTLHLLVLCRLTIRLAHHRCSLSLSTGPGGRHRAYSEESLLLIALLRIVWQLSYQDTHDWLQAWPALALACGLPLSHHGQPHIPSTSQQWKHGHAAGALMPEVLRDQV